jgi:hypothetical protein
MGVTASTIRLRGDSRRLFAFSWTCAKASASTLVAACVLAAPAPGLADVLALDVPLWERAPHVVDGKLRVVVVGTSDPRIDRLAAQRLSSRRRGEARGKDLLHRFVDRRLAAASASARVAVAVHRAVDAHTRVVGHRPLVAGGTSVMLELPIRHLRRAAPGVRWTP